MGSDEPELPSPYAKPPHVEARPFSHMGFKPGPSTVGWERWSRAAKRLWYGEIRHWRGLRVQSCPECRAERGFRPSEPPPPSPTAEWFPAFGTRPRPWHNRESQEPPPDDTGVYWRTPPSILRADWVSCVVCGTIIIDENRRSLRTQGWRLAVGMRGGSAGRWSGASLGQRALLRDRGPLRTDESAGVAVTIGTCPPSSRRK